MSAKEQQAKDELRRYGHTMNQMLNSGQGPDNATFYNYLQYKMNNKGDAPQQLGTP